MDLITEHIATWTAAKIPQATGGRGRGRGPNGQSPHGIKKLRELILELAVRGKLVPQDSNDEPASVLLEKIAKEKTRLVKEGKIKKQYPLPKISEDEKPFDFLEGWECERLGNIAIIQTGTLDANASSPDGKYPFFTCAKDPLRIDNFRYDTEAVLLAGNGNFDVNYYFGKFEAYQRTYIIEAVSRKLIHIPFLHKLIIKHADKLKEQAIGGVIKYIKIGFLTEAIFSIPPLAEQHRIVAKVDELMALCDKLEQQQTDSNDTHQTLVETLLATLTTVADPAEFALSWQRIADHFDTLFTTEESIDQLKQTILQLAVMGKLVPQNPNDEPANTLLEKIAKEKALLVKEGKIKKQMPLPKISENEKAFELPLGWAWVRLGETGLGTTGKTPPTGNPKYYAGDIPFIGPGQITPEGKIIDSEKGLTEEGCEYSALAEEGDILMVCIGGSIGKSAIARSKVSFNQQINCIRPLFIDSTYLNSAMRTPHFQTSILDAATGSATPIINRSKWEELLVSLPPLSEQHRIVAKVDELMTLCDTLKEWLHDAQTTQVQLADAIVEQAVA